MFGMGVTLTLADFARVLAMPQAVVIGVVCQYAIVPLMAWIMQLLAGRYVPIDVSEMTVGIVRMILLPVVLGLLAWPRVSGECSCRYTPARHPGSSPACCNRARIRSISAASSFTSGGRTWAASSLPSSTSASFIRLCMSNSGWA